ncbi:MAG: hypothetical protein JW730_19555 [Anaerolineales bacterium]|nr:hypothetical protein [Anaerolineales bacterium]
MDIELPEGDSLLMPVAGNSNILVITGERGVGKTTYCQQAVDKYRKAGLRVSGLLSPARFDRHQKNGFFTFDLDSHETRLAASSVPDEIMDGLPFGSWIFDPETLEWGNHCLKQVTATDVLVIDELGPLEFKRQMGWMASFEVLRDKKYRLALVVIRPECIDFFSQLGFVFQTKEITDSQAL